MNIIHMQIDSMVQLWPKQAFLDVHGIVSVYIKEDKTWICSLVVAFKQLNCQ